MQMEKLCVVIGDAPLNGAQKEEIERAFGPLEFRQIKTHINYLEQIRLITGYPGVRVIVITRPGWYVSLLKREAEAAGIPVIQNI